MADHAEDILSFEFGVKTLLRTTLEFIIENTPQYFTKSELRDLPSNLCDMLYKRLYDNNEDLYICNTPPPPTTDPLLNRAQVLHKGI